MCYFLMHRKTHTLNGKRVVRPLFNAEVVTCWLERGSAVVDIHKQACTNDEFR